MKFLIPRGIGSVALAGIIGQVANIAILLVIIRQFSPEILGKATAFMSLVLVFATAAGLKLELLFLKKDNSEIPIVFKKSVFILILTTTLFVSLYWGMVSIWPNEGDITLYQLALPLAVFSQAGIQFAQRALNQLGLIRALCFGIFASLFLPVLCVLLAMYLSPLEASLAAELGYSVGSFLAFCFQATHMPRSNNDKGAASIWALLQENWRLPILTMPQSFINRLGSYLPYLLIPYHFDEGLLGLYALSTRIVNKPVLTIGKAAVFFSARSLAFTRSDRRGSSPTKALTTIFGLLTVGYLLLLAVFGILPEQFLLAIFGERWGGVKPIIIVYLAVPFLKIAGEAAMQGSYKRDKNFTLFIVFLFYVSSQLFILSLPVSQDPMYFFLSHSVVISCFMGLFIFLGIRHTKQVAEINGII